MRDWRDLRLYFRAMADPRRMRMVAEIAATPDIGVKELCVRLKASQPLVSWHLRVLVQMRPGHHPAEGAPGQLHAQSAGIHLI